jgi:cell division protein FtsB
MIALARRLRALGPRWIVAGLLALLVVAAIVGDNGMLHLWRLRAELAALQRDVQALEAENEQLSRNIGELRDNPEVIERIAREELGLVRPGERVLRFPRTPRAGEAAGATTSPPRSP